MKKRLFAFTVELTLLCVYSKVLYFQCM